MLQFGHAASAVQGGLVSDIGGLGGVDAGDVKTATGGRSELELAQSTHRGTRNSHVDSIGMSAVGRKKKNRRSGLQEGKYRRNAECGLAGMLLRHVETQAEVD